MRRSLRTFSALLASCIFPTETNKPNEPMKKETTTSITDAIIYQRKSDHRYIWRAHLAPFDGFSAVDFLTFEACEKDAKDTVKNHLSSLGRDSVQVQSVYAGQI